MLYLASRWMAVSFHLQFRQFQLDEAVASIGGDAAAIQGDSTNLADLDRIYATHQGTSRAPRCAAPAR
jgi:hypothetical protein